MGSCMYLYPQEARFDLPVLMERVKTKHLWWFIKEMPERRGVNV